MESNDRQKAKGFSSFAGGAIHLSRSGPKTFSLLLFFFPFFLSPLFSFVLSFFPLLLSSSSFWRGGRRVQRVISPLIRVVWERMGADLPQHHTPHADGRAFRKLFVRLQGQMEKRGPTNCCLVSGATIPVERSCDPFSPFLRPDPPPPPPFPSQTPRRVVRYPSF